MPTPGRCTRALGVKAMRAPRSAIRAWLSIHALLISVFLAQPSLAAGPEPPLSPQADLNPEARSRLAESAQDSTLEPWQRDFMLGVARGRVEGGAATPSPRLPGLALPPAGIAANDGTWATNPPPSGRSEHAAIYDPVRDRMVVFGGYDGTSRNDVWALSLAGSPAWTVLAPAGSPPDARKAHTAIYDPVRDRMVVFGGVGGGVLDDVWALSWDHTTPTLLARFEAEVTSAGVRLRWQFGEPDRVVSVALERTGNQVGPWMPLMLDSRRTADAMEALDPIVTDGETYYYRLTANLTDGSRATFGPISAAAVLAVKVSGLTGIAPNPTAGSARIDFALVREEKVRISVVDVTGREAALLADGQMVPGSHSVLWDGRGGNMRLPAGAYFVRWTSATRTMSRKLVVLP